MQEYARPLQLSLAALTTIIVLIGCSPSIEIPSEFEEQQIDLATYNLHDLGVVDANGDQLFDIFTLNHSAQQSLALNQGSLHFKDAFSERGLDQDAGFPGLALIPEEPVPDRPGLFINWRGADLVIRSHQLPKDPATVSGTIDLLSPIKPGDSEGFTVKIEAQTLPLGATQTFIHFSGGPNGYFAFQPKQDAVPIHFHFDQGHEPVSIYVGVKKISPPATDFTLHMRDRHAMAWADYNGDMQMDVFIARGALSGTLRITPLTLWDALYVQQGSVMTDIGESALPDKRGCPGRQSQWVDFDRDNRLDLFIVCGRGQFANQLLKQSSDGAFADVAIEAGLGLVSEGKFIWFDDDTNGYPDLFWVDNRGIYIYHNHKGHFEEQQLATFPHDPDVSGIRIGDADGDGDTDMFLKSPINSRLLMSGDGTYAVVDAASMGLPVRTLTSNWVDVDNDGTDELYSAPGGIYRRTANGSYMTTGVLRWDCSMLCPYKLKDALASWVDLNNDGTRDLVLAINLSTKKARWASWMSQLLGYSPAQIDPFGGQWVAKMFINSNHQNHWLQAHLVGPQGNRQGLGARVTLRAGDFEQTQHVSHAEGSRYSQGHYRVYFGLGKHVKVDTFTITWADGIVQSITNPQINSLLTVKYNGPAAN